MKTIEINLYEFDELGEEEQKRALRELSDINTDFDWWEFVYEDAEQIGCEIKGFDLWGKTIGFGFKQDPETIAENIIKSHGKDCDTYKAAKAFKKEQNGSQFKFQLKECYFKMLENDYAHRTSKEAIIETIECNDYEFAKDGTLYHYHLWTT